MAIINPTPQPKEVVILQRDDTNTFYEEVHISGANRIIYIDSSGHVNADDSASFYAIFPPSGSGGGGGGGSSVSSSWASSSLSSSIIPYNGNRAIKRNDPDFYGINVGGTDVTTFLNNFFFPFIPATILINSGTSYYETGSSQTIITTATITANDEVTYGTGSIKRDGISVTNPTVPPLTFVYTDTGVITNHSYVGYSQTNNNGSPAVIASSTKTITFIYPFFYGLSTTAGLSGNTLYTTLTKDISIFSNKTYAFTGTNTYLYFAYPNSYIDLVHVLDPSLFQVLTSFEYSSSVPVTSSGLVTNWSALYKVYKWNTLADFTGGSYQFQFS